MAIDPDRTTYTTTTRTTDGAYVDRRDTVTERRGGGIGRTLLILLVAAVVLGLIAWALGLLNFDASGEIKAPEVKVEGGELPKVQMETGDIDIENKKVTVDVPTVDVDKVGDDGSANK